MKPRFPDQQTDVLLWAAVSTKAQDRYSIEDQLKLGRAWCANQGAHIVEELVVRGFSRDYWTLADVVAAAADDPDMEAFARLQAHIRQRSFNVFLCFDADRFGRTTSLVHEVIGRITRDCRARIYTLFDGIWIDAENAPMIGTLKALKAQQDVDRLKGYRETGMHNRARDGKSTSAEMPLFHRRVRDEKGKEIGVVVNEDLRPLWTDLAALILRGVSWEQMERALFEEFGHGRDGAPYAWNYMRRLVTLPAFWGHAALNYNMKHSESAKSFGAWIWDASVPPPPHVTVYRDTLPAVYGGAWADLGEQVKAELWRRYRLRGKATPTRTFRFHGLLVCDECGYTLNKSVDSRSRRVYLRCETHFSKGARRRAACSQKTYIRAETVQDYLNAQLTRALAGQVSTLVRALAGDDGTQRVIDEQARRLQRLQRRLEALVSELADAPETARAIYRRQISETSGEFERASSGLDHMRASISARTDARHSQARLLDLLREQGVGWLWQQPDTVVHQYLSIALGHQQLVVRDGAIIGTAPVASPALLKQRRRL